MTKRFLKGALFVATIGSFNFASAGDASHFVYSIDSLTLMQESNEGKAVLKVSEDKRDAAINKLKEMEKELRAQQETLQKQAALMKPEILKEKTVELQNKEKKIGRERDALAEELQSEFQVMQEKLFATHLEAAKKVFQSKSKGDGMLIDIRAPGVLAVGKDTDITSEVLAEVNAKWDADQKKVTPTRKA